MAPNANQLRLIVGIDYGTTYSGISFALSNAADHKDIVPWTKYPGAHTASAEHTVKAPTRIALAEENKDLNSNAWGYQVEPGMKSCSMTKLLLDKSALLCDFDDENVYSDNTDGLMRLPKGKSAKDIATEYLRQLHNMFEKSKSKLFGSMNLDELPVDFWLTVPASWSEKAKVMTKSAAMDAGFGSRPIDRVMLISEPEAAAHYTLKTSIHQLDTFVKKGNGVMICDCGGGTVDITTYEIEETKPLLKLKEIAVGFAGKCGATFIDRNFVKLMTDRFGEAFTSLDSELIGTGSSFMNQFEQRKKDFSRETPSRRPYRLDLYIPTLKRHRMTEKYYERRTSSVLLTHEDMQKLFDPAVEKVLKLISNQVKQAEEVGEVSIDTIALVGGFGSSPYLGERVQEWCSDNDIRFTTPVTGAWSAIVCGAVLRGLEGSIVREKKCRRHYGFSISRIYSPLEHFGYDSSKRETSVDEFDGYTYLDGFVQWQTSKVSSGENLDEDAEFSSDAFWTLTGSKPHHLHVTLYSCNLDEAPDTIESPRVEIVGKVPVKIGMRQLATAERVFRNGRSRYRVATVVHTKLNDESGHLIFRVLQDGLEIGRTAIELDD